MISYAFASNSFSFSLISFAFSSTSFLVWSSSCSLSISVSTVRSGGIDPYFLRTLTTSILKSYLYHKCSCMFSSFCWLMHMFKSSLPSSSYVQKNSVYSPAPPWISVFLLPVLILTRSYEFGVGTSLKGNDSGSNPGRRKGPKKFTPGYVDMGLAT